MAGLWRLPTAPIFPEATPGAQAAALAKCPNLAYGVNILGFGATPQDFRPLRGTALAGKGKYHDTQTASELAAVLDMLAADARQSSLQDFLLNDLAGRGQTGIRVAFGSGSVHRSWLALLDFILIVLGLIVSSLWLLGSQFHVKMMLLDRLRPFLTLGLGMLALLAWLLLLALLLLGFPVENQYRHVIFAARTSWLMVIVVLHFGTMVAVLLLWRHERWPTQHPPRIEVTV